MAEIILGHCTFCGLVRRPTLSCLHSVCTRSSRLTARCSGRSGAPWCRSCGRSSALATPRSGDLVSPQATGAMDAGRARERDRF
eukprot:7506947-Pyramimonas_sp.AAC.1